MGSCKQLLPLGNITVIEHCLGSLLKAGIQDITLVVSAKGNEIIESVSQWPVAVVINRDENSDMAASVRVGLTAVRNDSTGVLIALSDHPLATAGTCSLLVECHHADPSQILIPTHHGKKGHPTLFPRILLDELANVPTLREIARAHHDLVRLVPVPDEGVILDMDTWEEYQHIVARYSAR